MALSLGSLIVKIGGDTASLGHSVRDAEGLLGKVAKAGVGVVAILGAIAVAATAMGAAMVKHSLSTIDAQSKLAYRLDTSLASLQAVEFAAELAGVSFESLSKSLGRVNVILAQTAREGKGPAFEALKNLGLSAKQLLALPLDQRLALLGDRFKALRYSAAQMADVLKSLGLRSQEVMNLFEDGGDAIRAAAKRIEEFGGTLDDISGLKVEEANDAWTDLKRLIKAASDILAVELAPLIKHVANSLTSAAVAAGGISPIMKDMVEKGIIGLGNLIDSTRGWSKWIEEVGSRWILLKTLVAEGPGFGVGRFKTALEEHGKRLAEIKERYEQPPSHQAWIDGYRAAWDLLDEETRKRIAARNKKKEDGSPDINPLSTEEKKALDDRLLNLKKSIASEDEAIRFQREKDLEDLKELQNTKGYVVEEGAKLRQQIEVKYQKAKQDLIEQRLEEGILTEEEILARKQAKQLEQLRIFEGNRTITEERAAALRIKIQQKQSQDMMLLQAQTYSRLAGIVDQSMSHIQTLVGQKGGAAFKVLKAISLATALVKGYEAVVGAWAAGNNTGIPGMGAIMAGITAAGVAAQIANLAAVQPGGAGGAGGLAGASSAGTVSAATPPAAQQSQTLFVKGDFDPSTLWSGGNVRGIMQAIFDHQKDGGKVVFEQK